MPRLPGFPPRCHVLPILGSGFLLLMLGVARLAEAQPLAEPNRIDLHVSDIAVRQWGIEEGLPQGTVSRSTVDVNGHVWLATFGGLVRFDGRRIEALTVRRIPVLVDNSVTAVFADPDGSVWFGTPRGTVGRMRGGQLLDTLPWASIDHERTVDDIARLDDGSLVVRFGSKALRYHAGRWSDDVTTSRVLSMLSPSVDGSVLLVTPTRVEQLARGRVTVLPAPPIDSMSMSIRVLRDRRGRVWVGQQSGLSVQTPAGARRIAGIPGPIRVLAENPADSAEVLWIGSGRDIYRIRLRADGADDVLPVAEHVLTSRAAALSIAFAPDGVLVVGTEGRGLFSIRANVTRVVTIPTRLSNLDAAHMVGDGAGHLWVTSSCSTAQLVTSAGRVIDSVPMTKAMGCAQSLALDARKRLWVGFEGGVLRREVSGALRQWRVPVELPGLNPARPLVPQGDAMLVGLSDGRIGVIGADDSWRLLDGWSAVTTRPIESLATDREGVLWVGQAGVMSRWQRGRSTAYASADRIPTSVPRTLLPDGHGGVWIGTYGNGLHYFRPGRPSRLVPLPDETVSALVLDSLGGLWMLGNRGLTVLERRRLAEWVVDSTVPPDARVLSASDGVPEGNSGFPAGALMDREHLAFASVEGLVIADVTRLASSARSQKVMIDRVISPQRIVETPDSLQLAAEERTVDVQYTMPLYRFADAAQFRYMLEGRDVSWINLGGARRLQLAALPPGRFTLVLQGRALGGRWQQASTLPVHVLPLWHERGAVRALFLGLLALIAAVIYRQRVLTLQARSEALEASLGARREAAELTERHQRELAQVSRLAVAGELTASLSHELGQPLAAIVNNAETARRMLARREATQSVVTGHIGVSDDSTVGDDIDDVLHDVVMQGRRASQVIREFRRFLRHGQGERELILAQDMLDSVVRLVRHEFAEAGVDLQSRVDPRTPRLWAERVLLQQVLVNLLQNALEATRTQPARRVLMRARPSNAGLRISVVDSGSGFAADVRDRAFEPFVTSRSTGMGMGLAIARRLIDSHGGSIAVGKLPNGGAVVSCWLPSSSAMNEAVTSGLLAPRPASHV